MKPTIDLTPRGPRLAFLNLKTRPQGNGGNKNRSGYSQEHAQANLDNREYDATSGPAEGDVRAYMYNLFEKQTGKSLPDGYREE